MENIKKESKSQEQNLGKRLIEEARKLELATESGEFREDYRYDTTGNHFLEATFGRLAVKMLVKNLQGKMLTIVESVLADKDQREATKSLVRREFSQWIKRIDEMALKTPAPIDLEEESRSDPFGLILYSFGNDDLPTQD